MVNSENIVHSINSNNISFDIKVSFLKFFKLYIKNHYSSQKLPIPLKNTNPTSKKHYVPSLKTTTP